MTCVYFLTFDYAASIEISLLEGERIISVDGSSYRRVWIEGTAVTREERFKGRDGA